MIALQTFIEVITVVCAPSLVFAAWMIWRTPKVENEAVSLGRELENWRR